MSDAPDEPTVPSTGTPPTLLPPGAAEPLTASPRRVGRYTLLDQLGRGGMGQVFRARRDDGATFALKVIAPADAADADFVDRFRNEAAALRALPAHPNVVGFVDAGAGAPRPFLVMELLDGGADLKAHRAHEPLPFAEAAALVLQAATGLGHIHAHGLVHRDVKPSNLFRLTDGTVKLIDFGLVQRRDPGADPLTRTGDRYGSHGYTAPEQWSAFKRADARADLFALGSVLYYLLTRAVPLDEFNVYQHALPDLTALRPDLTAAQRSVLRKAVRHNPAERFQTAAEFAAALGALLAGTTDTRLNSVGMAFVRVPAGAFEMGGRADYVDAKRGERLRRAEEPLRTVTLSRPTWVGAHPVTRGQYARVLGLPVPTARADHPVADVSWYDAAAFCARLSELPEEVAAGRRYRLPTEAEWERAARAGSDEAYAFGPVLTADRARFTPPLRPSPDGPGPVAEFPPNAFGVCGAHGNVWEWCADLFDAGAYALAPGPLADPPGPATNADGWRAQRGGSFRNGPEQCRSSFRKGYPPDGPRDDTGFRVVLDAPA